MKRRQFLKTTSVLPITATTGIPLSVDVQAEPFPVPPPLAFREERSKLRITGVRMVRPRPKRPLPEYTPAPGSWSTGGVEVANPMSIYPKYKAKRELFMADDLGPEA